MLRLDYSNGLLYGLHSCAVFWMQAVQNSATYKALHGLAPGYLCELVVPYEPRRVLRSAESNVLTVPPAKPGKYGSRRFVRASANLWNSLRGERTAWLKNSPTVVNFSFCVSCPVVVCVNDREYAYVCECNVVHEASDKAWFQRSQPTGGGTVW